MKKLCLPLAATLVALSLCAGCVVQDDPAALKVMGKKTDLEKPYMTEIFDHYRETTGNALELIEVEDASFETEALRRMGTDKAPDILLHFHNADLMRFDVEENFVFLNDEEWVSDLTESARAYCTDADGNLLGLPFWESSVSGCYYNKTLLEEKGLGAVATQEDFDGLCDTLLKLGVTPILWAGDGCSWMPQFGLDPIFADDADLLESLNRNEVGYADIPAVADMVGWISSAAQKGWFGTDYRKTGWDGISPALASGSAAMTFIWDTWFYTDFTAGKYTMDDFELMPIFMNTAKEGTYEGGNLNMMMVNAHSERREEALEFLRFCATPENYNVAFRDISTVSVFQGQTTNIQSQMVTDAMESIRRLERVSTASTKILGYSAEDTVDALSRLMQGRLGTKECVEELDRARRERAKNAGAEGF